MSLATQNGEEPALDPMSLHILADVIDMLGHQIVMGSSVDDEIETLAKYDALRNIYDYHFTNNTNPTQQQQLEDPRPFFRKRMANLYVVSCVTNPYGTLDEEGPQDENCGALIPLAAWEHSRWSNLETSLLRTRNLVFDQKDDDDDDKLKTVLEHIRVQKALCDFRWTLEKQIRTKSEGAAKVDPSKVQAFGELIQSDSYKQDERVQKVLQELVIPNDDGSLSHSFQKLEDLRKMLDAKPFCLCALQDGIRYLLQSWTNESMGKDNNKPYQPILVRLGYSETYNALRTEKEEDLLAAAEASVGSPTKNDGYQGDNDDSTVAVDNSSSPTRSQNQKRPAAMPPSSTKRKKTSDNEQVEVLQAELQTLKDARENLQRGVQDPLAECHKLAATATRVVGAFRGEGLYKKKKSASRIMFDDDSDSDDQNNNEENERPPKLTAVPQCAKVKTPKKENTPIQVGSVELNQWGSKKRVPFAADEKTAIKEGVRKFGVGKWANIKSEYAVTLRNRTGTNIKDCYRTLVKRGEV